MFESIVSEILTKYLGKFVKGLDKENLKIAIWGGDVVLKDLEIRVSALANLNLPVAVKSGFLGELRLKIPWSSIRSGLLSEPIVIIIRNIFVIAASNNEYWDVEEEEREQEKKQKKLTQAELLKQQKREKKAADQDNMVQKPEGFVARLVQKAIDNIQITIEKIHIRYEDNRSEHPFACGLTLDQLSARSTDSAWKPAFLTTEHELVHKLVEIKNLAVYWDTDATFMSYQSTAELSKKLNDLILSYEDSKKTAKAPHYIVRPVSSELKVIINKERLPNMEIPKATINFLLERVSLGLEESQFRDIIGLLNWFQLQAKGRRYRKLRPQQPPMKDPKAWWTFATNCALKDVKEKRRKWTGEYYTERRRDRLEYIKLYKLKLRGYEPAPRLAELERKYSYEDLLYFRSLAELKLDLAPEKMPHKQETSSWLSYFGLGSSSPAAPASGAASGQTENWDALLSMVTLEQKRNLYASIGYTTDEEESTVIIPKDYVQFKINFHLTNGKGVFKDADRKDILFGQFDELDVGVSVRQGSFSVVASLGGVGLYDRFTEDTKFPCLMRPSRRLQRSKRAIDQEPTPIFTARFDFKPPDQPSLDFAFRLTLGALDCVVPPRVIGRLVTFFLDKIVTDLKDLRSAAQSRLRALRSATKAQLMSFFSSRKAFTIDVDATAPLIIWPKDFQDPDSLALIADLGQVNFSTTNQGEANDTFNEKEVHEDDFYDQFNIQISSVQALLTPYTSNWRPVLKQKRKPNEPPSPMHFVEKFDINLKFGICKVLSGPELAKVLLIGDLPSLKFYLSPVKIASLIGMILRLSDDLDETLRLDHPDIVTFEEQQEKLAITEIKTKQQRSPQDKLRNKIFELRFTVPKASLMLRNVLLGEKEADIVRICLRGLAGQFVYRKFDMAVFVGLHNISVKDMLQKWGPEFRFLVTSKPMPLPIPHHLRKSTDFESQEQASQQSEEKRTKPSENDLIKAYYFMIKEHSPEYERVDNILHIVANSLHLMVNRETVVSLLNAVDVFMGHFNPMYEARKAYREALIKAGKVKPPMKPDTEPPPMRQPTPRMSASHLRTTIFKLTAVLQQFTLTLNKEGKKLALCTFGTSSVQYDHYEETLALKAILGNVDIYDLTPEALYYHIAEIRGEKLVEFTLETFSRKDADFPGFDSLIRARINSIRFIALRKFLREVANYMAELRVMHGLVSEAAHKITEAASEAMENLKKNVIKYEAVIINPQLVIPRNSKSKEHAIADLGQISIFNHVEEVEGSTWLENISISMNSMNLRCTTDKVSTSSPHYQIIKDIDVILELQRPSDDKEHKYPEIKISGNISSIEVSLTDSQFTMLLGIWKENMLEGPNALDDDLAHDEEEKKKKDAAANDKKKVEHKEPFINMQIALTMGRLALELTNDPSPATFHLRKDSPLSPYPDSMVKADVEKLKLLVLLLSNDSIVTELSARDVNLLDTRPTDNQFQHLITTNGEDLLKIKDFLASSQASDAEYTDDASEREVDPTTDKGKEREGNEASSPAAGRLKSSTGKKRSQNLRHSSPKSSKGSIRLSDEKKPDKRRKLLVHYVRKPDGEQKMSAELMCARGVVIPDAVYAIKDFVWPKIDELTRINDERQQLAPPSQKPQSETSQRFQMCFHVRDPELYFLEDPKRLDTPRVLVRTDLIYRYLTDSHVDNLTYAMSVMLERFEIRKSALDDCGEAILPPIDFSFNYERVGPKLEVYAHLDPINLTFSYKDYLLLSKVVMALAPPSNPETGTSEGTYQGPGTMVETSLGSSRSNPGPATVPLVASLREMPLSSSFTAVPTGTRNKNELEPTGTSTGIKKSLVLGGTFSAGAATAGAGTALTVEVSKPHDPDHKALTLQDIPLVTQTINVEIGNLRLFFINDCRELVPLIDARITSLSAQLTQVMPQIEGTINFKLKAQYYNVQYAKWEPVIEPWACEVDIEKTSLVTLKGMEVLNLNITKAFFDTMDSTIETWKEDMRNATVKDMEVAKKTAEKRKGFSPLFLSNMSEQPIRWWFPTPGHEPNKRKLKPNAVIPLREELQKWADAPKATNSKYAKSDSQRTIAIELHKINEFREIGNLPLHKVGKYLIPLLPIETEEQVYAIYEVALVDGSKMLTLRSNILLRNETSLILDVQVQRWNKTVHNELKPMAPMTSQAVPIWPSKTRANSVWFRPAGLTGKAQLSELLTAKESECGWSETGIKCFEQVSNNHYLKCPAVSAEAQPCYLAVNLQVQTKPNAKERSKGDHVITISPPLILENVLLCDMEYALVDSKVGTQQKGFLARGEQVSIHQLDPEAELKLTIAIPGYRRSVLVNITGPSIAKKIDMAPTRTNAHHLYVNLHNRVNSRGIRKVSVFAQFWMLNHTGLPLFFKQVPPDPKENTGEIKVIRKYAQLESLDPKDWYGEGGELFGESEHFKQLAQPTMFAYHKRDIAGNKASVKIADSKWAKPFSLETAGTTGVVEIQDKEKSYKKKRIQFELGVDIDFAPGKYGRTKVVTFTPRLVLVNHLDEPIYYKQKGFADMQYILPANSRLPFHWLDLTKENREIAVCRGEDWHWTGPFSVDTIGTLVIKCRTRGGEVWLMKAEVKLEKATCFVIFYGEEKLPPYKITNWTSYPLTIYQKAVGIPQVLASLETVPYCWDAPSRKHELTVELASTTFVHSYNLDQIKLHKLRRATLQNVVPVDGQAQEILLQAEVFMDGPTRHLKIVDSKKFPQTLKREAHEKGEELQERVAQKPSTKFTLQLKHGLGISLIDATPQEVVYVSFGDIHVEYCYSEAYGASYASFCVHQFQVDNMLYATPLPVVVFKDPNAAPFVRMRAVKRNPTIRELEKSKELASSIDYYKLAELSLNEMDIYIEEQFLLKMVNFFSLNISNWGKTEQTVEEVTTIENIGNLVRPTSTVEAKKLYFERLTINPIALHVTLMTTPNTPADEENPVRWAFGVLGFGIKIPDIDRAPIRLNYLDIHHPFATSNELVQRISSHYMRQAIREAYKVLGSFDFLGNPVSLVSNLGTGVKDFFFQPIQAFATNPKDIGAGLSKGTSSLVKNSMVGVTNSLSKVTDTVATGITKISVNHQFQEERIQRIREQPTNAGQGLLQGAKSLGKGLASGVAGVFVDPIVGATNKGSDGSHHFSPSGLAKGLATGVLGVVVKPTVGVLDSLTKTTQGVRNQADSSHVHSRERIRLPRYIGQDKVILPYSELKAYGQFILYTLRNGSYQSEWYRFHERFDDQRRVLLVTNKAVIWVNSEDAPKYKQEWRVRLERIKMEGSVEKVPGLGVRLVALQGLKKGLYTLTAGASAYFPPSLTASSVSSSSSSSVAGTSSHSGGGAGPEARGGVVRHIPIADPQLLEEVYQGVIQAISDEVLGDHKWDEIMAYA